MRQGEETDNHEMNQKIKQKIEERNKSVDMQDRRPADIVCSKCSRIIVPASKAQGMRERTIAEFVEAHTCQGPMESKRDFEGEVR